MYAKVPKHLEREAAGLGGSEETCVTGGVGLGHLGHVHVCRPHQPVDPLPQSSKPCAKPDSLISTAPRTGRDRVCIEYSPA